jgi:FkbM family methyltransferase
MRVKSARSIRKGASSGQTAASLVENHARKPPSSALIAKHASKPALFEVPSQLLYRLVPHVARRDNALSRRLYDLCIAYVRSYNNNLNYDPVTNGEYLILDRLVPFSPKVVFDVGANKGQYSLACLRRFPAAVVHAFEIVPKTAATLVENLAQEERVTINSFGLSDVCGAEEVNLNEMLPGYDEVASLIGPTIHEGPGWTKQSLPVTRGDAYCSERGISRINLLKLDVEGAEHKVLRGFDSMMHRAAIDVVQFEFGMTSVDSKFLLKDFWQLFSARDFVLGPVMPNGVRFRDYDYRIEDFQGPPNFLAVHRSKPELIATLKL